MQKNKAFSIIELLVVIAIIGVIAFFAYPAVQNWIADRNVKKEMNSIVEYIEEKKSLVASGKYPIIAIRWAIKNGKNEVWHMTQEEYTAQMKVPAPGWTYRNQSNTGQKSYLNHYKMAPGSLDNSDTSNWVRQSTGLYEWSNDVWHWMNGNMVISKDALINPGANHFTVLDQNGAQQDVAFMVCSKSNTSNHYDGSGSGPKCNNSSNAENRYVLQMDRSLNVNLFKYNSKTSRWIKVR